MHLFTKRCIDLTYHWEFICAPSFPVPINNSDQAEASFFPTNPGLYCVKVTLDSKGDSSVPQQTAEAKIRVSPLEITHIRPELMPYKDVPGLTPPDLDFPCIKAGTRGSQKIKVKNRGFEKLVLYLQSDPGSPFKKTVSVVRLNPGQEKTFSMSFKSRVEGTYFRVLQMTTSPDLGFQPRSYVITGEAVGDPADCAFGQFSKKRNAASFGIDPLDRSIDTIAGQNFLEISAQGGETKAIRVEIYNLGGASILHREVGSDRMVIELSDRHGEPLPNGLYLYVLTRQSASGEPWKAELKKLVIRR